MNLRAMLGFLLCLALTGCASGRSGIVDTALDDHLYMANTKAERLLRYFEIQALLVRFAANSSGSIADRNAIALANVDANYQLRNIVACLRVGSVNSNVTARTGILNEVASANLKGANPYEPVLQDGTYCSFFESRLLDYQQAILDMLIRVAKNDPDAKLFESFVTGLNILNFTQVINNLTQIVSHALVDAVVLEAFKSDANELRDIVYNTNYPGPEQIPAVDSDRRSWCADPQCAALATSSQPTILVWHFQEVQAYMTSACSALNGDLPAIKSAGSTGNNDTNCSSNMPFSMPAPKAPNAPSRLPKVNTGSGGPGPSVIPASTDGEGPTSTHLKVMVTLTQFHDMQVAACQVISDENPTAVGELISFLENNSLKLDQPSAVTLHDFDALHAAKRRGLKC